MLDVRLSKLPLLLVSWDSQLTVPLQLQLAVTYGISNLSKVIIVD
jgi:hypothetical protein